MFKKLLFILITMAMVFGTLPTFVARADSQIKVIYNGAQVNFDAPPIMQNNRVLVPLRAIAEAMGVHVEWTEETQSIFYFNNKGIGYYLHIDNPTVEIDPGAGISHQHIAIEAPPTITQGRTFVPLRFIAESFDVKVDWDNTTRTVVITGAGVSGESTGVKSDNPAAQPTSVQLDYLGKSYTIYAVPGTGKYSGWRQLKGFPGENLLNVFFKHDNNETTYQTEYVGKYAEQLKQSVTWTDQLGRVHVTTIGELFAIQTDIDDSTITKMEQMYGDMYDEWFQVLTIDYTNYIDDYLTAIGEQEPVSIFGDNPYSYLHDQSTLAKLNDYKANINYNGKSYTVYSIPSDNGWRQLKGFYGEDYFDLFFYPDKNMQNVYDNVSLNAVSSGKYDFNKNITWIGLDYKTYTSKLDVYNAINYNLTAFPGNAGVLEYYTDSSKGVKPLDIVSQEDKNLYSAWSYIFKEQYRYFVTEYLAQVGVNVSLPEVKYTAELKNFISRKLSADEITMLINNYFIVSASDVNEYLTSDSKQTDFDALIWKKMGELSDITAKMKLKQEDYAQYQLESEYISESNLRNKYKVSLDLYPETEPNPNGTKTSLIYYGPEKITYDMGRVPTPIPLEPYNANGIRILRTTVDGKSEIYLNIKDIQAKLPVQIN